MTPNFESWQLASRSRRKRLETLLIRDVPKRRQQRISSRAVVRWRVAKPGLRLGVRKEILPGVSAEFEFNESTWPIVTVIWPSEPQSDDAMNAAFERMASYVHRGSRYCILHDGRSAPSLSAKHRRMGADIGKRDAHLSRERVAGAALVYDSALLRGAITAVNWLFPPPYPQKAFKEMDAARAWCAAQLERAEHASAKRPGA